MCKYYGLNSILNSCQVIMISYKTKFEREGTSIISSLKTTPYLLV